MSDAIYKISMTQDCDIEPGLGFITIPFDYTNISSTRNNYYVGEWIEGSNMFKPLYRPYPFAYLVMCEITFKAGQQWDQSDEVTLVLDYDYSQDVLAYRIPYTTDKEITFKTKTLVVVENESYLKVDISHSSAQLHTLLADSDKSMICLSSQQQYFEYVGG